MKESGRVLRSGHDIIQDKLRRQCTAKVHVMAADNTPRSLTGYVFVPTKPMGGFEAVASTKPSTEKAYCIVTIIACSLRYICTLPVTEVPFCPNPTSTLSLPILLISHRDGQFPRFHCKRAGSLCVLLYDQAHELEKSIDPTLWPIDSGSHEVLACHGWSLSVSLPSPLTIGHIQ